MDIVAENYQLKWHSFSSYMHSCIAGTMYNETFADVALYTLDGLCVMAHKFILSSCSQYFHQVLKLAPRTVTTMPLVIVLPPEITHKTLRTLVQYMYSGESTVSKDILQQVLRGGDILKVKGLWRPREESEPPIHKKSLKSHKENGNTPQQESDKHKNSEKMKENDKPKVLNYSLNLNQEKCTNKENAENSDPGLAAKIKESSAKENHGQNSVIKTTGGEKLSSTSIKHKDSSKVEAHNSTNSSNETLQFFVIKEEPIEWTEMSETDMEIVDSKEVFSTEITIKPEIFADTDSGSSENMYTPLTCELCSETFTIPADWVRHVQTHTDMLPAKRQRRGRPAPDEENAAFPPLTCDMCQKMFPTPAEWVHHIQNTHTEFELHWTNRHLDISNKDGSSKPKPPKPLGPIQKVCSICTKKFPSHASMLIHKRTHTGEKPYACEYCTKGFNVKSNLLRHLRTLHDKIINPTEVDSFIVKDENEDEDKTN